MSTERVGCWILRYDNGDTRLFGSVYPTLAEDWDHAEIHAASWLVVRDDEALSVELTLDSEDFAETARRVAEQHMRALEKTRRRGGVGR